MNESRDRERDSSHMRIGMYYWTDSPERAIDRIEMLGPLAEMVNLDFTAASYVSG